MDELPANTTLSHYRIVTKLGAGGMGEAYLAQDTKLDRKVVLKILPPDVAADETRMRRFVQEAKAASALNHPHIIAIHEIEQIDSMNFIATEFIDGETLRQRILAGMKLVEILEVAIQTVSALAGAHAAGIIHRDIKPCRDKTSFMSNPLPKSVGEEYLTKENLDAKRSKDHRQRADSVERI